MDKYLIFYQIFNKKRNISKSFLLLLSILLSQDFRDPQFNINFDNYIDVLDENLSASFFGEISSNQIDELNINCIVNFNNLPQDWVFTTCINTNCYSSNIDTIVFPLSYTLSSNISIDVAATTLDIGNIELEFFDENTPTEKLYSSLTISNYLSEINTDFRFKNFHLIAYPNPFNNNLNIKIASKISEFVSISIFNVKGESVKVFDDFQVYSGETILKWSGINSYGNEIQSGIYFILIKGNFFKDYIEVLYIK